MKNKSPILYTSHTPIRRIVGFVLFALCIFILPVFANAAEDTTPPIVIVPPAEVSSVEMSALPKKTEYFEGDKLSLDGAKIKINYSDGESETVNVDPAWVSADISTAGEKTVTVTYYEHSTTFTVTVKAIEVISIKITKEPQKTEYFVGEPIDTDGLAVTAYYNNGDKKTITPEIALTGLDSATAGEKTVSVTYGDFSDTFKLNILEPSVSELSFISMPKTAYFDGEEFSPDGCTVLAVYNSGKREEVSEGFTFSGFNSAVLGEQEITLHYGGLTLTFKVSVTLSPYHTHTPLPTEHITLPTCTEFGLDRITCAVCLGVVSEYSVAPLGHSFDELTLITPPTAEAEGKQAHTCTVCSHVEEISIEKLTNILESGDFTLELLGEGCVFPYLSTLKAEEIIQTLTQKNVDDLNAQLSGLVPEAKLVYVINVSVVMPNGEKFTPECDVKLTYNADVGEYAKLYTIVGARLSELERGGDTISLTDSKTGQFLVFTSTAPETTVAETTAASTQASEGNSSPAVILVAAIGVVIVLIVVAYVYVIKKFYY
jgi:hypothetical protein